MKKTVRTALLFLVFALLIGAEIAWHHAPFVPEQQQPDSAQTEPISPLSPDSPAPNSPPDAVPPDAVSPDAASPDAVPPETVAPGAAAQSAPQKKPATPAKDPGSSEKMPAAHCTLEIRYDTLLPRKEELDAGKQELVGADGTLFAEKTVSFTAGETVFDVLLRELQAAKIHLEYVDTPLYHSAYIEGMGNLYEFDCGALSGWVYSVNGVFPNYGSGGYALQDGDKILWQYTCDLGVDVGGNNGEKP